MRIEECRPLSKRKSWLVVERNGETVGYPPGFGPQVVEAPAASGASSGAPSGALSGVSAEASPAPAQA